MIDLETQRVVKICGLRDEASARAAALAGADLLGFILAESRRKVSASLVRQTRAAVRDVSDAPPVVVGVMVNPGPEDVIAVVDAAEVDMIQLSGDESPDLLDEVAVPVIKAIHVAPGMEVDALLPTIDPWFDHARAATAILIDAKVDGVYGGSGTQSDWLVATQLAERYPAILAGGLRPGNVFESIQVVRPRGVDVSSGVEIDGVKDHVLIESFVAHARQAFQSDSGDGDMSD